MAQNITSLYDVPSPSYVLEESLLRRNLSTIRRVADETGVEIILAFKAYALWKSFPILREYISASTASSLNEALLGYREMGARTHTYAPVYKDREFGEIMECSSHITFNSLNQLYHFLPRVRAYEDHRIDCGLRINPEYSEVETALYNPASPDSRMGVPAAGLPDRLPEGVTGLHFHTHCESDSYALERSLRVIEDKFGYLLNQAEWLNMGGGHLMTRQDYDVPHLIGLLRSFRSRYPHLHVIMEPGSAFGWQTGPLVTEVLDVVENGGVRTLMIDASFTCHMPDCLEMPYLPAVRGAEMEPTVSHTERCRIGGNSCLSGDVMGDWYFERVPQVGDRIIFEDMNHYTTVKTTMFNGIHHPSIYCHHIDERWELYREYTYEDYKSRMC